MVDKYSKYKREQPSQEPETDQFSQYAREKPTTIPEDIYQSLKTFPGAAIEMAMALPGEVYSSGKQIVTDPLRAGKNVTGGLMKGMRGAVNLPAIIDEYLASKDAPSFGGNIPKVVPTSLEQYLIGEQAGNAPGDTLLRGFTEFLPFSRIGAGVKGLTGAGKRAAGAGLYGASTEEVDPIHAALMGLAGWGIGRGVKAANEVVPIAPTAAGIATGVGAEMLGFPTLLSAPLGAAAGYLTHHGLSPTKYAKKTVLTDLSPERIQPMVEASKRLGLPYITPAEASRTFYEGKKGGQYGATAESSRILSSKGEARSLAEKDIINKTLDDIYNEKTMGKPKEDAYNSIKDIRVPGDALAIKYSDDPIILQARALLEKDPAYQKKLRGVSRDSVGYWDQVKRVLDDLEESATGKFGQDTTKSREYDLTRKELIKELDLIAPDYPKARRFSELEITRREIERLFDKKPMNAQTLGKAFESEKFYNDLMFRARDNPALQQKITDMRDVFPNLIGTAGHKKAEFGERTSVSKAREVADAIGDIIKGTVGAKYENAIANLITSPDWPKQLEQMQKKGQSSPLLDSLLSLARRSAPPTLIKEEEKR